MSGVQTRKQVTIQGTELATGLPPASRNSSNRRTVTAEVSHNLPANCLLTISKIPVKFKDLKAHDGTTDSEAFLLEYKEIADAMVVDEKEMLNSLGSYLTCRAFGVFTNLKPESKKSFAALNSAFIKRFGTPKSDIEVQKELQQIIYESSERFDDYVDDGFK